MCPNRCAFCVLFLALIFPTAMLSASPPGTLDPRDIRAGDAIPDDGYCDQPYVVITKDGNWLCALTTAKGREGDADSQVVSTISADRGKTWSKLVPLEPGENRENVYSLPLVTPGGRVYVFYNFNGDNFRAPARSDSLGWFVYRYSDDNGRTWSKKRYRLPMPLAPVDRNNTFGGKVQLFWGIGKPITTGGAAIFAFSRCGKYPIDKTEGWFYRSDNILTEKDPERIEWKLLPDGDVGLKNPKFGEVQAEHNLVPLSDGSLYCMYRTRNGYPCHAYSRDGGHTWTMPEYATYSPGGRKIKNPRACPKVWRPSNGKFLFWHHPHGVHKNPYSGRNPAWLSGGVERDGMIHWSQPEIVLYDTSRNHSPFDLKTGEPGPGLGMSYPDLIEQDGRYWITETQKTIARVHEIDPTLLEGLWSQGELHEVTRKGLALELDAAELQSRSFKMPRLPDLSIGGGFAIDFWIKLDRLAPDKTILDSRDKTGRGIVLKTAEKGAVRLEMNDGRHRGLWSSDPGTLDTKGWHHVAVIVDGGPNVISYVVDGQFQDGGDTRRYGWGRFTPDLGDVTGSGELRVGRSFEGDLRHLRIYDRYLRTSEAVANYHAGRSAKK
ncbi:MAG: exo-alpha-sialidase [Pirellulales bacterium]|nr:exo-alpha-sialidase [Pirellulales bacterium]